MSLERKYVIVAVIVAFIAWARLTDWFPSFRWIPWAFLTGFLAATVGFLYLLISTSKELRHERDSRRGLASARPAFLQPGTWEEEKARLTAKSEYRRPIIFPNALACSKSVDDLVALIIRDHVTSWWQLISPRPIFQNEIDRCIRSVLLTTAARFTDLDIVEIGVNRFLPLITTHLQDFYNAERIVRGKDLKSNVTESEELNKAIASKYKDGMMHPATGFAYSDRVIHQQAHLRSLVIKILPAVLPDNMKTSQAVLVLIRELVACAVLVPIMNIISDPDFWNQMIVSLGGPLLQDRKSVRKLREALDQHAPATITSSRISQVARLGPDDSERQFERFIRAIRNIETLFEARRTRSEVLSQLKRETAVEAPNATYVRRLETGKRLLDQRITVLSTSKTNLAHKDGPAPASHDSETDAAIRKKRLSLREVIYDASGLSYFMEYMDRQKLMRLVQFYLVVDGFRNPLEGDHDEPDPAIVGDSERMDIAQMYEGYLSRVELNTPEAVMHIVKQYLRAGAKATAMEYAIARQAVLQMQTRIYEKMRSQQFENFKKSDLYYKWLAIEDHIAPPAPSPPVRPPALPRRSYDRSSDVSAVPNIVFKRPPLPGANKEPELRKAILSPKDLPRVAPSSVIFAEAPRRSLDDVRKALFDDDLEDDRMTKSLTNLKDYDIESDVAQAAREEAKVVDAMKIALDDIVGQDHNVETLLAESAGRKSTDSNELKSAGPVPRTPLHALLSEKGKPSIASLGLVGVPSKGVFEDDLFGDEAEKFVEDEREDQNGSTDREDDHVQEAAPGDLGLIEAIGLLSADIERLHAQRNVLVSLTAKAELTNNAAELRILRKSEQSLQREIHRKEMQKQQYIVQESDNSLFGRASVSIKSVMIGREDDGHEYALYVIEVRRQAGEQMSAAVWAITRRYSQFHDLHKRLRARFPAVRDLDFPRRQTLFTLQKDFIQRRRTILERYLRSLLLVPAICRSRELRAFLSQSAITTDGNDDTQIDAKDFVTRIYNSVSDGMEDFLGNIPVLDQLSAAGQNLITAATAQMSGSAAIDGLDPATQDPATATEAEAELNAYDVKEAEPFVKPICDLFLELFELSKGNSWLRGRTVVVILHQLLGGTIERKVRESARNSLEDEALAKQIDSLKNILWPDGKARPAGAPRTVAEKARTRREASLILGALIPDLAGSVVGRSKAQAASRKIVAVLNNHWLNEHLLYTLLDELTKITFPEL